MKWVLAWLIAGLMLITCGDYLAHSRPPSVHNVVFLFPPKDLEHFSLGYNDVVADSLWIRAIQDFDICETSQGQGGKSYYGPGKAPGVGEASCEAGWLFKMLDAITDLSPRFLQAYSYGATALSVIVDDRIGAKKIFDKGLLEFPNNWSLNYKAGYHYLFELKETEIAAQLMRRAAANGAPPWIYALSANLYTKLGQAQLGISILEEALLQNPTGHGAERIKYRLDKIRAELNR